MDENIYLFSVKWYIILNWIQASYLRCWSCTNRRGLNSQPGQTRLVGFNSLKCLANHKTKGHDLICDKTLWEKNINEQKDVPWNGQLWQRSKKECFNYRKQPQRQSPWFCYRYQRMANKSWSSFLNDLIFDTSSKFLWADEQFLCCSKGQSTGVRVLTPTLLNPGQHAALN